MENMSQNAGEGGKPFHYISQNHIMIFQKLVLFLYRQAGKA